MYLVAIGALVVAGRRTAAREVTTLLPNLARLFKGLIPEFIPFSDRWTTRSSPP